jgi:hypothetical protein
LASALYGQATINLGRHSPLFIRPLFLL